MASKSKKTVVEAKDNNAVVLSGTVLRANQREKVCRFTLDVQTTTPKGNISHAYIPVTWFNSDTEDTVTDGERVGVNGSLRSGSYEKDGRKVYTIDVIAESVVFEI